MFSTYNESSLHGTLKNLYSLKFNGKTEVSADGHVYDILCDDGTVIEIQTKNLSQIKEKCTDAINKNHHLILVHPLVVTKTIETYDENGRLKSRKKSPKKGHLYDIFRELTGIYPILLKENFTLEVLEVNITEIRKMTKEPVQTLQKSRRFKKNWIKTDKKLDSIIAVHRFSKTEDYEKLLPKELPCEFCTKNVAEFLKADKNIPKRVSENAGIILWVLVRMNIIKETEKKGRSRYYKIIK